MVYRALIVIAILFSISGCVARHHSKNSLKKMSLGDVYAQSVGDAQKDIAKYVEQNLKEQKTFGYVQPYVPVVQQPIVRKVWIPDHKSNEDADVLIAGHWVYVMIEGPRWFIDTETSTNVPIAIIPGKPQ